MISRTVSAFAAALALAAAPLSAARQPPAPAAAVFEVEEKSIAELQAALSSGAVTSRALVLAYLARVRAYDLQGHRSTR